MTLNLDRLLSKVALDETGCWLWIGSVRKDGYGQFFLGKMRLAHRVMYEHVRGPIPIGLQIDHLCRTRHCVNPWHMEAVTQRENILRGIGLPAEESRRTHCVRAGHPLLGDNLYVNPRGERECKRCRADHQTEWRERHDVKPR